jgi:hypothetical protein
MVAMARSAGCLAIFVRENRPKSLQGSLGGID